MTEQELNALEQVVREHKVKSATSNIVLKVAQVERLIALARNNLKSADVISFDIAAEIRREERSNWRYIQRWQDFANQQKLEREHQEKLERRKQRRAERLERWKNSSGNQRIIVTR